MKRGMKMFTGSATLLALACLLSVAVAGCKEYRSYWINVTVVNRTSASIRDVEVDYPSAGFGINLLAPGAVYHYRLKVNGNGKVHTQYPGAMDKTIRVDGPLLKDGMQGTMWITLLPGGTIRYNESLAMGHE